MRYEFPVPGDIHPVLALGVHDSNLRLMERLLEVKIHAKNDILIIEGTEESCTTASHVLKEVFQLARGNTPVSHGEIKFLIEQEGKIAHSASKLLAEGLVISKKAKKIKPRSIHQSQYIEVMHQRDLIFGVGPAGTGKTYLAMAVGLFYLFSGKVKKLILTRPVVEAGESLGFLPGTFEEKLHPYLRPLFDALEDILSPEEAERLSLSGEVEIAPLAYMRGRTLSQAFVILDEAQNATRMQMKMFLTRLGEGTKMVVTGDVTQIDLPSAQDSGLVEALHLLTNVPGIAVMYFDEGDIVRHPLVARILSRYEQRKI
ncbi:PhoH family protein [Thermospira aquatica]|uniref:PhoH-like protein n=1 Tax=Thermospira aquatica TaxID=2828656 RepID=A0AAX3BDE6_9SPIR|nr:PhoH family protein [Thermospira aquatica]URA10357.1 PhoH family protein [Thermospira aquatica]